MKDLKIQWRELDWLKPYKGNPRVITDEAIKAVAESISEFGFKNPILTDADGVIIAGHTRRLAAQKLGLKTVPVVICDDLTEEQVNALRLADNKTGELAQWDPQELQAQLLQVGDIDMSLFGFDLTGGGCSEEPELEEVEEPAEVETRCQFGDIWKLGEHRLICGDSTDGEDIRRLMDGSIADLVVTDPPYNVDYEGGTDDKLKIANDNMSSRIFQEFLEKAFLQLSNSLKPCGSFYIWHASRTQREFENALNSAGLKVRQQLIWNKNTFVLGRQDYQWKHEPCFYGWKDGTGSHFFIDRRNIATVMGDSQEINPKRMTKAELVKLAQKMLSDQTPATVIDEDKPSTNGEHPTMKPVRLIGRLVYFSSKPGDLVLDTFGGSGSTLIACEQLGRRCFMSEFDPHYCDVIIARWEKLTGREATKIA